LSQAPRTNTWAPLNGPPQISWPLNSRSKSPIPPPTLASVTNITTVRRYHNSRAQASVRATTANHYYIIIVRLRRDCGGLPHLFGDLDRLIGDDASQVLNISDVMEPRFARLIVNDPVRCWSRARITRSTRSCGAFSHSHRSTSSASRSAIVTRSITAARPRLARDFGVPSAPSEPWKQKQKPTVNRRITNNIVLYVVITPLCDA